MAWCCKLAQQQQQQQQKQQQQQQGKMVQTSGLCGASLYQPSFGGLTCDGMTYAAWTKAGGNVSAISNLKRSPDRRWKTNSKRHCSCNDCLACRSWKRQRRSDVDQTSSCRCLKATRAHHSGCSSLTPRQATLSPRFKLHHT